MPQTVSSHVSGWLNSATAKPKGRAPERAKPTEAAKREALALAFRRLTIRQGAAEEKARARSEAKSEARHKRAVARRENANGLAVQRVKACQRYLSPHAVEQLAAIAKNSALASAVRIEAANELLRIGFGPPSTAF